MPATTSGTRTDPADLGLGATPRASRLPAIVRLAGRLGGAEVAGAFTIASTALFVNPALSERAFRLLHWIANRPEPPAPVAPSRTR